MFNIKNQQEMERVSGILCMKAREWIKLNRHDLDSLANSDLIEEYLRTEVSLFAVFEPFDVDHDTGEYSLKLDKYAFCNKKYADKHKLNLTGPEGGNMGRESEFLTFTKYIF